MKSISILSTVLFILVSTFSFAQSKKESGQETIKVWGNCGMCKKTIETAAKTAGATSADWNDETKMMVVSFTSATSSDKIQQAIAAAGYDTEKFTADQKAYDNLHSCCQYDRKVSATPASTNKADCCKDGKCAKHADDCCKDGKCSKEGATCCKDGKCDKSATACKDKSCCKS